MGEADLYYFTCLKETFLDIELTLIFVCDGQPFCRRLNNR